MAVILVVAAIIRREGKFLITRRPGNVHLAGLWEFPGGKVEEGESLQEALLREILEEIAVQVAVGAEFFQIEHQYPTRSVRLHFFDCTIVSGEPQAIEVSEIRWVAPHELQAYAFPEADRELIARLRQLS
jgi:mutator protein MutT